jgi:hypothetical protein
MEEIKLEARRALQALLWNRGGKADGRPLYKYRFTQAEFERARKLFISGGNQALKSIPGRALFLLFLAEWFRRERSSGAWGWEQPLAAAGLLYSPHEHALTPHQINYAFLQESLVQALRFWRRPEPQKEHTKKYLWAVVSESGFPMGAFNSESGLKRWIENAVAQMFQGVPATTAVASQSYRLNVEDLRTALRPIAEELVVALFELKRFVLKAGPVAQVDAIAFLDEHRPDWREGLPVDISGNEIRSLVEETLLAPTSQDRALDARRLLRLKKGIWEPAIAIELAGDLPDFYFQQLSDTLEGASRASVYLRGDMQESLSRRVAVLEKSKRNDRECWECRSLSSATSFGTSLSAHVSLVIQVGDRPQVVLTPRGSTPITDSVNALTTAILSDESAPTQLEFAPSGSFDTPGTPLFLLSHNDVETEIKFTEASRLSKIASVAPEHGLLQLHGEALMEEDGVQLVWRTDCKEVAAQELSSQGSYISGAMPPVFRGVPQIQSEDAGTHMSVDLQRLHWRPMGKRRWTPTNFDDVRGEGDLGIISEGRLIARTRVRVVDPETKFKFEKTSEGRRLRITNSTSIECRIWVETTELEVDLDQHGWIVDLDQTRPGSLIKVELRWEETRLSMRIRDTSLNQCISASTGEQIAARPVVDLSTLSSLSVWSKKPQKLIFEARGDRTRFDCIRTVAGETSLAIFRSEAQELLGLFESPDAHIRLSWLGDSGWAAQISRYTLEQPRNIDWSLPVEQIKNWLKVLEAESLVIVPVCSPSKARKIETVALASQTSFRTYLAELSDEGPWIIAGEREGGGAIKPFFVDAGIQTLTSTGLNRALLYPTREARRTALIEVSKTITGREQLAEYVAEAAKTARRHTINAMWFDALSFVADHPEIGISVLANLSAPEDIEAVLELEIDLPFLWVLSPTSIWAEAFRNRAERLASRMSMAGVDDIAPALRATLRALEQIWSTIPELSVHASWAALAAKKAFSPETAQTLKPFLEPFEDRIMSLQQEDERELQNQMVCQRVDGLPPPNLDFSQINFEPDVSGFPPQFDGVISVSTLAALCASGRIDHSAQISRLCKRARLYDHHYFTRACPTSIFKALTSPQKAVPA